ncbi:MAG: hypothetical protein J6L70_00770 [Alphaproteobacteria bacterium]|nr:hypothetical protein [Alphaproteobacteria bacterium]
MSSDKVRITQEAFDDAIRVKLRGTAATVVVLLLLTIAMNTCSTEMQTRTNTELNKQQLEIAKKQYQLDSMRFEYMKSHQK